MFASRRVVRLSVTKLPALLSVTLLAVCCVGSAKGSAILCFLKALPDESVPPLVSPENTATRPASVAAPRAAAADRRVSARPAAPLDSALLGGRREATVPTGIAALAARFVPSFNFAASDLGQTPGGWLDRATASYGSNGLGNLSVPVLLARLRGGGTSHINSLNDMQSGAAPTPIQKSAVAPSSTDQTADERARAGEAVQKSVLIRQRSGETGPIRKPAEATPAVDVRPSGQRSLDGSRPAETSAPRNPGSDGGAGDATIDTDPDFEAASDSSEILLAESPSHNSLATRTAAATGAGSELVAAGSEAMGANLLNRLAETMLLMLPEPLARPLIAWKTAAPSASEKASAIHIVDDELQTNDPTTAESNETPAVENAESAESETDELPIPIAARTTEAGPVHLRDLIVIARPAISSAAASLQSAADALQSLSQELTEVARSTPGDEPTARQAARPTAARKALPKDPDANRYFGS